jgi:multidrug efflux system membrane fusion protein
MDLRLRASAGFSARTFLLSLIGVAACNKPPARPQRPPATVSVTPVRRQSIPFTIEANGTVTPMANANVASQVDGIVLDVAFREGQEVQKGDVLFRIDPRPYENAYNQARSVLARDLANYGYAQSALDRYTELRKSEVVTQDDLEAKRAAANALHATVIADSANVATAKFNLDNTIVRAPISGRTGALLVKPGNLVRAAGTAPLVVINQVRPILVRFAVPGSQLPLILHYGKAGGLPVTATPSVASAVPPPAPAAKTPPPTDVAAAATPVPVARGAGRDPTDPPPQGTLYFIDNAVDTATGTVQLKAIFDNRDGQMWAGLFVSTSLRLFVEDSAIVVPAQSVVAGQRGTYVYVVDSSSTAQQRPVVVERSTGGLAIIASGLDVGERVVTEGQSRLSNGAPVEVAGREGGGAGAGAGRGGRRGVGGGGRGGRGKNGGGGRADQMNGGGGAGGGSRDPSGSR